MATDPEYKRKSREASRQWALAHPERMARYTKANRYRSKFGIELDDFEALVVQQESKCEICGGVADLVADHDHGTGKFRGAVCGECNSGLGFFADSPDRLLQAAMYLIRFSGSALVAPGASSGFTSEGGESDS